jgi:energy-coupling factor transporter ATP-binding protein EcfA2
MSAVVRPSGGADAGNGVGEAVPQSLLMTQVPGDWEGLAPALRAVGDVLGSFTLSHSGGEDRRRALRSLVGGYLVPRLADPDGLLVVAVVGGSGGGKSTLLNSLARHRISPSSPLRPTTLAPLVWSGQGLPATLAGLPGLPSGRGMVSDPAPPAGLVLVDTPPPSVVGEDGRPAAASVLEVADACLFVASGIRYADAAGWDLIDLAVRRRLPSLFVLNRLSGAPEIQQLLQGDFTRRLIAQGALPGQGAEEVVGVAEGPVLPESGGLASDLVTAVRKELEAWADPATRRAMVHGVVTAALGRLDQGLAAMRAAIVDEVAAFLALADPIGAAYGRQTAGLEDDLSAGRLAALAEGPAGDLAVVVVRRGSRAARAVASAWESRPAGRRLLAGRVDLWAHGPGAAESAERRLEEWANSLPDQAAAACGRTLVRRRRARRETEALRRASLDPAFRPEQGSVRRPGALAGAAEEARRRLGEVLGGVLADDAARFRELLGPAPLGALLTRLRLEWEAP